MTSRPAVIKIGIYLINDHSRSVPEGCLGINK